MTLGIGERLKSARLSKKLSHESISHDTHISVHYLESLEKEDWSVFSARVYLTGFLRKYADYLGLDSAKLLETYNAGTDKMTTAPREHKVSKDITTYDELPTVNSVNFILIVLLLTLATGFYLSAKNKNPYPQTEIQQLKQKQSFKKDNILEVQSSVKTWLFISEDNRTIFEGYLVPGAKKSWNVNKRITIRSLDADDLSVMLNNRPITLKHGNDTVIPASEFNAPS